MRMCPMLGRKLGSEQVVIYSVEEPMIHLLLKCKVGIPVTKLTLTQYSILNDNELFESLGLPWNGSLKVFVSLGLENVSENFT